MTTFLFDKAQRRYLFADTNELVPAPLLRQWIDDASVAAETDFRTVTEKFVRGEIDFDQWRTLLRQLMRDGHNGVSLIAFGGLAQMTADAWSASADELRFQNGKLNELFLRVSTGQKPLDGRLVANAGMYAQSIWQTHENLVRRREAFAGLTAERRVVAGDAWTCEDCQAEHDKGWSPIGSLKRIGDTSCVSKCRCFFVYKRT
jgi:hypothetical protein